MGVASSYCRRGHPCFKEPTETIVGLDTGDHPFSPPVFPPRATEGGDIGTGRIRPCLEVICSEMVLGLPGLHQHEKVAEERGARSHPHEHLA
jgi:hypothetical protein